MSELLPGGRRVRTLSIWSRDRFLPDTEYDLHGTPCETVLRGETRHFPHSVHRLFPADKFLVDVQAESYLAIPLLGHGDEVHGHLAVIHGRPLALAPHDLSVFRIFGARAAAEVLRRRTEEDLRKTNEELRVALGELQTTQTQLVHSQRMASIARLVAGITHELNTPAGVISSVADMNARCVVLLEELSAPRGGPTRARAARALEMLANNSRMAATAAAKIAEIVDALGRFVRLDEPHLQPTDVSRVVEQAVSLVAQPAPDIEIRTETGNTPDIWCYPSELGHMLLQLLWNAAEAIDGRGSVTVRTRSSSDRIAIDVIDTGRGIPPEDLGRVFEPGFTSRRLRVGKGLGLPICHNIVRKHGGDIQITSEVGKGTQVTVLLPLRVPDGANEEWARRSH